MTKPRVTYRVIAEVKQNEAGGKIASLQRVQKFEGATMVGKPEFRLVSYQYGKMLPIRGQGAVQNLWTIKTLYLKMENFLKALEATEPNRPEPEEEIEELLDLEEDSNITDEDF